MQRLGIRLAAAVAICVMAGAAHSAAPRVQGAYAFVSHGYCEAQITTTKNGQNVVTSVNPTKSGQAWSSIGYINFVPTNATAAAGNATITGSTLVEGGALRINGNGFNWTQKADNQASRPYSFTPTTFTYAGMTYQMVYADPYGAGNASFRTVYLLRKTTEAGQSCYETIQATKQTAN